MIARAKVFAFACIDPRFLRALETFIEKKFNLKPTEHDIKTDAGGINRICAGGPVADWMVENAILAHQKHGTRTFVLCNHMGCSYYQHTHSPISDEHEIAIHEDDLKTAARIIKCKMPDVEVFCYIVKLEEGQRPKYIFDRVFVNEPELTFVTP